MTLGGSGRSGAYRDFPGRERGAGTVKSHPHQPLPIAAVLNPVGCRRRGEQAGTAAAWQRVSSTRKAPSKVTLGTKSPPSHRSGGFVPLHRPPEPPPPAPLSPRSDFVAGSYFANHFIMGGEKFDSTHPEGYLFGENSDLNFLGNRPVVVGTGGPELALCDMGIVTRLLAVPPPGAG